MKLGFVSDSLGSQSFAEVLDHAARMGLSGVEVNTGGWSTAPHFDLAKMKSSADARKAFLDAFADRGLEVIALNANGNPCLVRNVLCRSPLLPTLQLSRSVASTSRFRVQLPRVRLASIFSR